MRGDAPARCVVTECRWQNKRVDHAGWRAFDAHLRTHSMVVIFHALTALRAEVQRRNQEAARLAKAGVVR